MHGRWRRYIVSILTYSLLSTQLTKYPLKRYFENILDVKFQLELLILSSAVDNHTELAKHTEAQVGIILEYLVKL